MNAIVTQTARLQLRRMTHDDIPALLSVFGDPEVMRYYPAPFDRERMLSWVDWNQRSYADRGYGLWALVLRATHEVVGDCGMVDQQVDGVSETEIGFHIRRDLWRHGLATEAATACRDYGFKALNRHRLISLVHPQNTASRRVAEKIGMTLQREVVWKNKRSCIYAIERQ